MQNSGPIDILPIWAIFAATVGVVLLSIEAGHRLGKFRLKLSAGEKESTVGSIVAATLGLLGFILAFTFGLAGSRFDSRREIVVQEANAIGTAYLRAGLLPDNLADKVRPLLRAYVGTRLDMAQKAMLDQGMRRSEEIHRELWVHAESAGKNNPNSIVVGLFIESLNETIDLHSTRVLVALRSRLPTMLWAMLYLITVLTMGGVGYHEGLSKSRRSLASVVLAVAFASIMTMIADLDRPQEGFLRVSQQALVDLQRTISESP